MGRGIKHFNHFHNSPRRVVLERECSYTYLFEDQLVWNVIETTEDDLIQNI